MAVELTDRTDNDNDALPPPSAHGERAMADDRKPEPAAQWGDPLVQQVYEILCDTDDTPHDPAEHWEGWIARRITDALTTKVAALEAENAALRADAERLDSGVIALETWSDFAAERVTCVHSGIDLRAAIDAARTPEAAR